MAVSEYSKAYHERMFPGCASGFLETDPEFIERFGNFAFDEVLNQPGQQLDDKTRFMAILATLLGCQGIDEFRAMVPAALNFGLTPVEVKEIVYQAVAYLGIGRVFPFLKATNEVLEARGVKLPLEGQATTTPENRREAGTQAQVDIFGEGMRDFWRSGPEESRHINLWLADNCFGDYYTRTGLDYRQRLYPHHRRHEGGQDQAQPAAEAGPHHKGRAACPEGDRRHPILRPDPGRQREDLREDRRDPGRDRVNQRHAGRHYLIFSKDFKGDYCDRLLKTCYAI